MRSETAGEASAYPAPVLAKGRGQLYLGGVFMLLGLLMPACMFLGVRGVAPVVGVGGLLCLPLAKPARQDWTLIGVLLLLVIWAAISARWSLYSPVLSRFKDWQRFTAVHLALQLVLSTSLVVAAGRLNKTMAVQALLWTGFALLIGAALLTEEMVSGSLIYRAMMSAYGHPIRQDLAVRNLAQGAYIVAVLIWPVGLALSRRKSIVAAAALAAFVPLSTFLFRGDASTIALALSGLVFLLVRRVGPPAVLGLSALVVVYFLSTPWVMLGLQHVGAFNALHPHMPPSWKARLNIWTFATQTFLDNPVRGLGLDSSRAFPDLIKLHPHNGALQIWFELGVIGAALGAAFWGLLFRRMAIRAYDERLFPAVCAATATVYLTIGALSFGLWQEWWICLGALAMAACVLVRPLALEIDARRPQGRARPEPYGLG
jgi:O-antigen ligase